MPTHANDKHWMAGSSPWKGAALAMLLESPGHPYGLAARLASRLGPAWPVTPKALYPILENMEKYDLAETRPELEQDSPPHRTLKTYYPTERTESAVDDWMKKPIPMDETVGLELCVRVAVAREKDIGYLLEVLDLRERESLDLLKEYDQEHPIHLWVGLESELVRQYAVMELKARLTWVHLASASLEEFAARRSS